MKISELILQLQAAYREHGNLDVRVYEDGKYTKVMGVATSTWKWVGREEVQEFISID